MSGTRAGDISSAIFRLVPRMSVGSRGMFGRKMEAGELLRKSEKISINCRNYGGWGAPAEILLPSDSVSIRGPPWTLVASMGGKWAVGNDFWPKGGKSPKCQKLGRGGRNISTVGITRHPRTSLDIRGMCGWEMEDGRWGIIRENREKSH